MVSRLVVSTITLTFIICTSALSVALEKLADYSDQPGNTDGEISSGRSKRDLGFDEGKPSSAMNKRPRQFVGKRDNNIYDSDDADYSSDYESELLDEILNRSDLLDEFAKFLKSDFLKEKLVGRFLTSEDLNTLADDIIADELSPPSAQRLAKRPRQFVGKRGDGLEDEDGAVEKRPRQFVGKRARQFIGKRARQFIGKRPRQFVGKRSDDILNYLADQQPFFGMLSKRPRQFVGKRDNDFEEGENFIDMSKRPRQFVGKRRLVSDDSADNALIFSKRPRQFVGKRSDISKRPRQFVGKRDDLEMAKRPRQFVGKRSDSDVLGLAKRPRQFVGRR